MDVDFTSKLLSYHSVVYNDRSSHVPSVSKKYTFEKPNDQRALQLMNASAEAVMRELPEIAIAYGVSDEFRYSFTIFDISRTDLTAIVLFSGEIQSFSIAERGNFSHHSYYNDTTTHNTRS